MEQETVKTEWDLKKYFYESVRSESYNKDAEEYIKDVENFVLKYKGKIGSLSDEQFFEFYQDMDALGKNAEKITIYLSLLSSLNTQDQELNKENARIDKKFEKSNRSLLFISEELKNIGYDKLIYYSELEIMKPYKNPLINHANSLKYILSEPEEKIYMQVSDACSEDIYGELTSSFVFEVDENKMTQDEVRSLRESQDREERKKAYTALANVFLNPQNQIVLGQLYALVCRGSVLDVELRGYKTVMSQKNIGEEVSDNTVNILLDTIQNNYSLYHRFLKKKAEVLGLDTLETYDIMAPYTVEDNEEYSFEKGWKLYMDTIKNVDSKLAEFSQEMLDNGRISVYPYPGKTGGAFAQYSKSLPEFVLLNWTNTYSDVTTLAHELGHAFHGNLSKVQTDMAFSTPLILAETASIFNETLMFETILANTKDEQLKKKLVYDRLDDIFATIFRQVMYVNFERKCHQSFLDNSPLTYGDFNNLWFAEVCELYGPGVNIDEKLVNYGWSSIPHIFHTPFYCYTYAFGNIISLNLFQMYKDSTNKDEFLTKYHSFLAAGGSDTPENLLRDIFGLEFNESFYSLAFKHIEDLLGKLD